MRRFARATGGSLDIAKARRAISAVGVALFSVACVLVFTGIDAAASTDFTGFSAPLTGAHDFAVNFPTQPFFGTFIGPIGLLDDGTSFFVADYSNGKVYKFPVSGGDATAVTSAPVGLEDMILFNGIYWATVTRTSEVVTFDPNTLTLGTTAIPIPCTTLGLSGDPVNGNLLVSTTCGIYKVKNPTSAAPSVRRFSAIKDGFDGSAFSSDGQTLWAADDTNKEVIQFDRRGKILAVIPDAHGPDGMVFALPDTNLGGIDISNNVFVNNNDGTIIRIDTNNGNASSVVATGGTRGDFATVGSDGCFYATQSDRVERVEPCFFVAMAPTTTTTTTTIPDTTTAPPTTTTTTAPPPTTTVPRTTTTTAPPAPTTSPPTTAPPVVSASAQTLAFTGVGTGLRWTAVVGCILAILGLGMLFFAQTGMSTRLLEWLLGRMG